MFRFTLEYIKEIKYNEILLNVYIFLKSLYNRRNKLNKFKQIIKLIY